MKKTYLLSLLLTATFAMTSCGGDDEPTSTTQQPTPSTPTPTPATPTSTVEPLNPNIAAAPVAATTDAATKLYTFLRQQYGRKVVSSVMADVNWNNRCADKVHALTGKYPAMNCYDFIHILKLQEAGIAATWRPFHEAAGNATLKSGAAWGKAWFWWGADGAQTYRRLWTTMFDYFKQKGISNLIWVWTTQNFNGNSTDYAQDTDWYPGDGYVDIVARDLYGSTATQMAQEFTEIQAAYPAKMVALGECGHNNGTQPGLVSDAWARGAHWSHFMVWYQGGQGSTDTMCSNNWWAAVMRDDNVITRDQLPALMP